MTSQRSRVSNRTIGPSKIDRRITVGLLVLAVFALVMHLVTGNRSSVADRNSIEPPASSVSRGAPSYPHDFGTVETSLPASVVPAALRLPPSESAGSIRRARRFAAVVRAREQRKSGCSAGCFFSAQKLPLVRTGYSDAEPAADAPRV